MKLISLIALSLFSSLVCAKDYSNLVEGRNISWDATASDMQNNLRRDQLIFWFGVVKEAVAFENPDGNTKILWLCEQHRFVKPEAKSAAEPLDVVDKSSGFFVVPLELPNLSPEEAHVRILSHLKKPQYVLVVGKPDQLGEFQGGIKSVMVKADKFQISDEMVVRFAK